MNRRTALQTIVAGAALASGCLNRPSSSNPMAAGNHSVTVDRIETFTHAIRLNDLGNSPTANVPAYSSFDQQTQKLLTEALEGTYETTELPTWVVEFVSATPYFRTNGEYYRLSNTLPTYTITAKAVSTAEVSGEIASFEEYREAVTHDGKRMTGLMRVAQQEGMELGYIWPSLEEFFETYDAVHFENQLLAFTVSVDDSGPPYSLSAQRVSPSKLSSEPIWDASTASPVLRDIIRTAGQKNGLFPLSDPPEELLTQLDAHQYVYLDGIFYTTYVEKRDPLPVSLNAAVTDTHPETGSVLELTLTNDGLTPVRVECGAPKPFGVLYFHPLGAPQNTRILWSDAYKTSEYVKTEGREVTMVLDIGLSAQLLPKQSLGQSFILGQSSLAPGTYIIEGNVGISTTTGDGGTFPYRVVFSIN